jgi:hypothetical protein
VLRPARHGKRRWGYGSTRLPQVLGGLAVFLYENVNTVRSERRMLDIETRRWLKAQIDLRRREQAAPLTGPTRPAPPREDRAHPKEAVRTGNGAEERTPSSGIPRHSRKPPVRWA